MLISKTPFVNFGTKSISNNIQSFQKTKPIPSDSFSFTGKKKQTDMPYGADYRELDDIPNVYPAQVKNAVLNGENDKELKDALILKRMKTAISDVDKFIEENPEFASQRDDLIQDLSVRIIIDTEASFRDKVLGHYHTRYARSKEKTFEAATKYQEKIDEHTIPLQEAVDIAELNPEIEKLNFALKENLGKAVDNLGLREKYVIKARYGLDDEGPMSLDAIAKKYDVPKATIVQILNRAEKQLRHPSVAINYCDFLE